MGYTHYASRNVDFTEEQWTALRGAALAIVAACEDRGIGIAGPHGDGAPITSPLEIAFNGSAAVGGEYESFSLGRWATGHMFCKTGYTTIRPYDLAVTAVLLAARTIAPDAIEVSSDGDMAGDDWAGARELVAALGIVRVGPIAPRRPSHWGRLCNTARELAPRIVQLSRTSWAVPSGANPMHGYVVTGPAAEPAHGLDVDGYTCTCNWAKPQGPDGRTGVGCKHALAVIERRLDYRVRVGRAA
ncbi:MAG: hypothetical protein ABI780_11275 [Ardenticatenales bacterium]